MNSGLTSHQQRGHTETGLRFKVSLERPEKREIDLAVHGLVVQRVIHYRRSSLASGIPYFVTVKDQDRDCSRILY